MKLVRHETPRAEPSNEVRNDDARGRISTSQRLNGYLRNTISGMLLAMYSYRLLIAAVLCILAYWTSFGDANSLLQRSSGPTVTVKNGSYVGLHSAKYDEDWFLGMPFAKPPLGDLRFNFPEPLNTSWEGTKDAKSYYPECVGYGVSSLLLLCLYYSYT